MIYCNINKKEERRNSKFGFLRSSHIYVVHSPSVPGFAFKQA